MSNTVCIYHGNCFDGFGAAWVLWDASRDMESGKGGIGVDFIPGYYSQVPEDLIERCRGKLVYCVDFCYPTDVMLKIAEVAIFLHFFDHHDDELRRSTSMRLSALEDAFEVKRAHVVFDITRSGAGITWDELHPNQPRIPFIDAIEDRDLFRFKYDETKKLHAWLSSYPFDFQVWDSLVIDSYQKALGDGTAILRKHERDVEMIAKQWRYMTIDEFRVPAVQCNYLYVTDVGNVLAKDNPFAVCYWSEPDGVHFSLRSTAPDGVNVADIAARFGGGGHRHASGFLIPHKAELKIASNQK